jgi:hypothetical protein
MPKPRYAESRWTKGPIFIGKIPELGPGEGMEGPRELFPDAVRQLGWEYPYMSREREFLKKETPQTRGSMYVNPEADATDAEKSRLFRHEAIHNLLDQGLGVDGKPPGDEHDDLRRLRQMHRDPSLKPYADKAKLVFNLSKQGGHPDLEIPAYLGTNETDFGGKPYRLLPEIRESYMRELLRLMQRTNPREASILKRMGDTLVGGN